MDEVAASGPEDVADVNESQEHLFMLQSMHNLKGAATTVSPFPLSCD